MVDPLRGHTGCGERITLLVERLMAGAHPRVAELNTCGDGGCGHEENMSENSQNYKLCDISIEATSETVRRGTSPGSVMLAIPVSQLKK